MSLPEQYETMAGENGSAFSSGERQRIGLARIFLQNNNVILLDEPAGNLDPENETLIMDNIAEELSGRTVVIITHRKSVAERADTIMAM